MKTIEEQLQVIKQKGRIGLMTHVVVGYPSLAETTELVRLMAAEGVDFVELQIPFSDPLADGPVIMQACETSLRQGTKIADAMKLMGKLSRNVDIPLLFMAYYNSVFRYGVERFCHDAAQAGAAGLIIPDVPIEEEHQEHFLKASNAYSLPVIHVISPVSTEERLKKNAKVAQGFIYCSARQGITGARDTLAPNIKAYLAKAKRLINCPIAVGFGISRPEHIKALTGNADIAVVGSALLHLVQQTSPGKRKEVMSDFLRSLMV